MPVLSSTALLLVIVLELGSIYISQLWHDVKNIEFVRQAVGHIKVEFTSTYVENLSDEEWKKRM